MSTQELTKYFLRIVICVALIVVPTNFYATAPQSPPQIDINSYIEGGSVSRGRMARAVVEMNIPSGYHVNSSRPLEKFLIPTNLQITASNGVRVGPVSYPRAILRNLKFSKNKVAVYEGRAIMRFNVSIPAGFQSDYTELKARLKYQSCSDEVCFPPQNRETTVQVRIK